ncbi:desmethyl-deoxy-podophyllotoxin synthase-like [Ziziphus jujuba]|uniref:Desmethyl-deoxy-podophyllotoxin synthase-like n=1 Tax=Ziziphus jujuba TaxID=326968 RepID=A0A6P6G9M1_ZIZJJ|nr:desmethyl-deoxy-podophyllotoxin synthase-like [Ziziphus jujuba]
MELQYSLSLTIFLIIFSLFWFVKQSRSSIKLPPGPWKLPVIGNLHNLVGSLPHHALRELARKHGPFMHLQLGQVSQVIISSPRMAREIMKTHDLRFAQRPELLAMQVLTYGGSDIAFAPYGDYWRQIRKVCIIELLSVKRVQSFASIREDEVWNLVQSIKLSEGLINFTEKIYSLTSSITCRTAFGDKRQDEHEFVSLSEEAISLAGGFDIAELFPSNKFLQITRRMATNKLKKVRSKVNQILENIIHEHRQKHMTEKNGGDESWPREEDLVDVLLRLQQSGSREFPLTTDNIKAVIWEIFTAGTDTSSTTVVWAMSEMMKNPRVIEKAQAEVRKLCQGNKGLIQEKDIQRLSYLKLVVKETLRLHPPGPLLLPRECREACKIDGYEIPLKTRVIVNAWAIGRDPEYWNDAESFIPERFDGSSIDYKGTDFEYIPFGAGRRMCPGIAFGMANVEIPLANLLYHFNWQLPSGKEPENLDMTEAFGSTVGKKNDLYLIAIPFTPLLSCI